MKDGEKGRGLVDVAVEHVAECHLVGNKLRLPPLLNHDEKPCVVARRHPQLILYPHHGAQERRVQRLLFDPFIVAGPVVKLGPGEVILSVHRFVPRRMGAKQQVRAVQRARALEEHIVAVAHFAQVFTQPRHLTGEAYFAQMYARARTSAPMTGRKNGGTHTYMRKSRWMNFGQGMLPFDPTTMKYPTKERKAWAEAVAIALARRLRDGGGSTNYELEHS